MWGGVYRAGRRRRSHGAVGPFLGKGSFDRRLFDSRNEDAAHAQDHNQLARARAARKRT